MELFFLVISLLFWRIPLISANPYLSSKVLTLTDNNFTQILGRSKLLLIQFYAPWCGHCKKIETDYYQAAERLHELQIECRLARYDGSENREFVKSLGVTGYPTFFLYRNGVQIATYSGPRYADDIVEFMMNRASPVATPVETMNDIRLILDKGAKMRTKSSNPAIAILGMFQSDPLLNQGTTTSVMDKLAHIPAAQNFLLSAELTDNRIRFMMTSSPEIFTYFGITLEPGEGCLVSLLFPPSEMDPYLRRIPSDASIDLITSTVASISSPTVIPFSSAYYREMQTTFAPAIHVLVFCDEDNDPGATCIDLIHKIAPKYRGRILFVTVPHTEPQLYKTFAVKVSEVPKIIALNMTTSESLTRTVMEIPELYEDEEEVEPPEFIRMHYFTEQAVLTFLENFLGGNLDPTITSEVLLPHEKTQFSYLPMHKVVASNFESLVVKSFQHFLLFVTAPWCGHCKSMEPTIRSIGKFIHKNSAHPPPTAVDYFENYPAVKRGIFVGKMDGTKNDFTYPGIVIRGFPTVLLFKKSGAGANQVVEVVPYNGERSINQIIKFLEVQDIWKVNTIGSAENDEKGEISSSSSEEEGKLERSHEDL